MRGTAVDEKPLTDQQTKVLEFVDEYARRQGFPPTLREIGDALGLANVNAVRGHLAALERKGYITREADKARSIRVVHPPTPFSWLKRKIHEVLRTDEGVVHSVVYGVAWATWRRTPYFEGERLAWIDEAIDREAAKRGWALLEKRIEPDHIVVVVEAWPNHSPQLVVRRFQGAGQAVWLTHPGKFPGKRLWAPGYVVTTDPDLLADMVAKFLEEQSQGGGRPPRS